MATIMNDVSQKDVVDLFLPELSMWNSRGISILWRSVSCAVWEEKVENLERILARNLEVDHMSLSLSGADVDVECVYLLTRGCKDTY